jgi:hypothetical protein
MSLSSSRSFRSFVFTSFALGTAIAIASSGAVRAEHVGPDTSKVYKCTTGTACITGDSTGGTGNTWGVYGFGMNADGVHGITDSASNSGVAGFANSSSGGNGVYGSSVAGPGGNFSTSSTAGQSGVAGFSESSTGSGNGIYGRSNNGDGVYGVTTSSSSTAYGIIGIASSGTDAIGVEAQATDQTNPALQALSQGSGTYIADFANQTSGVGRACVIDPDADLTCAGNIEGNELKIRQKDNGGRQLLAYTSESATPTIEDLGASRLTGGVANVALPSDFSSVMSHQNAYYVFLTPMGDTRGLYVAMQTPAGFQVRENERGHSNVEFQYRIVGVPSGEQNVRLPAAAPIPTFHHGLR